LKEKDGKSKIATTERMKSKLQELQKIIEIKAMPR
jgi:hypothetical protein